MAGLNNGGDKYSGFYERTAMQVETSVKKPGGEKPPHYPRLR